MPASPIGFAGHEHADQSGGGIQSKIIVGDCAWGGRSSVRQSGVPITDDKKKRGMELCQQASKEQDPKRFFELEHPRSVALRTSQFRIRELSASPLWPASFQLEFETANGPADYALCMGGQILSLLIVADSISAN